MKLNKSYQINYTILSAGTEIEIIEQRKKWANYSTQQMFLFKVKTGENKDFVWWDCLGNIRGSIGMPIKTAPAITWLNMMDDYINNGWTSERIIKAGLIPKIYASFLPQYIKYHSEFKTAPNL